MLQRQFPTVERLSIERPGVSFYVVIAMRPRFAGERGSNLSGDFVQRPPKWVIVVDLI